MASTPNAGAKFAIIGFGEAGPILAEGLAANGAKIVAAYDILVGDPKIAEKGRARGVPIAATAAEAVAGAEVVISAVVSTEAEAAARSVAPYLKPGQFYMDINSASPAVKKRVAATIEGAGADFVEAAVMDLFPPHGHKAPMLLAGKRAKELEAILRRYAMRVEAIGEAVGTASAVKMVRSVFLKGFTSILLESLVAAHQVGAEERVLDSLQTTFPEMDWRKVADYYAERLVKHARRQSAEMHEVAETLTELGVEPITALASAARLGWLADLPLGTQPRGYADLLRAIDQTQQHVEETDDEVRDRAAHAAP
jgi:3-hydroxyisobutyrate dehydrogenase-like beta-hydroxyacid dehydrogenase